MNNLEPTKSAMFSAFLFWVGCIILVIGVFCNLAREGVIAGLGTMSMNSYYLLASAFFLGAIAAKIVFKPE